MVAGASSTPTSRILFVTPADDQEADPDVRLTSGPAVTVRTETDAAAAEAALEETRVDCVVCVHAPPVIDATEVLPALAASAPAVPRLVVADGPADDRRADGRAVGDAATDVLSLAGAWRAHAAVERGPDDERGTVTVRFRPGAAPDGDPDADGAGPGEASISVAYDLDRQPADSRESPLSRSLLERLHEITADPDASFDEQVSQLLDLGSEQLGLDIGFLARIDEETDSFEILAARGDHEALQPGYESDLAKTYCRRTVDADTEAPLAIDDAATQMAGDPAYEALGLGSYLGAELVVDGDLYGTFCFADDAPRPGGFSTAERTFIDLVAQWLRQRLEERRYRRDLRDARTRMEKTLERVDDAFFAVDDDWHVTFVNEAAADILSQAMGADYGVEELVGRHLWDEIPDAVDTPFYEKYHEAMATMESVSFESHYEPLDVWFEVRAYPDTEGLSVYFTDITGRKRRERTLERYESVMRTVSDAVISVDESGTVQTANPAVEDLFGHDPADLEGESLTALVPPRLVEQHEHAFQRYLETGERQLDWDYIELPGQHADGSEVPIAVSFSEYEHESDRFFTGVFRDITERKEREQTLNDLLAATQAFVRASDTEELVDAIIDGAEAVFDYEIASVRLYDPETETLPPTRVSAAATDHFPEAPVYDATSGPVGAAFQSDESRVIDDLREAVEHDYGAVESAVFLPIGDHGLLGIGATEPAAFDEDTVALVELLALTAESAFDRLERESEMRQLNRILDHVEEMVFLLDASGQFAYVTPTLASYLGYDREALSGRGLADIVVPDAVAESASALDRVRDCPPGETIRTELPVRTTDGDRRPVELELSSTGEDGSESTVAGVMTDISELAATRTTLATERERFQELFENLPDPVAEVEFRDGEPLVQYVNSAFAEVFGVEAGTVDGANLNHLIVPEDGQRGALTLDGRAMDGEQTRAEVERQTADGRRDFLLRGIPYPREGGQYGFAVYTDITEQKERERYLQVIHRVLRHNLRNNLTVVLSLARRLRRELEDDRLREDATTLVDNAEDIASLSEKVREIEQVVGQRESDTGAVDAATILRETVASYRRSHPTATVELDVPDELWVRADERLRRVVEELTENALEHADSESPTLCVEADSATSEGWVRLHFRDDGPGIPDSEWEIIAGDTDITQLTHASGLGLWLTRWLIESFGGKIEREGIDDGTTVTVMLSPASGPDC